MKPRFPFAQQRRVAAINRELRRLPPIERRDEEPHPNAGPLLLVQLYLLCLACAGLLYVAACHSPT